LIAKRRASYIGGFLKVDPLGNVWFGNGGSVLMFHGGDLSLSPIIIKDASGVAFDAVGNVYVSYIKVNGRPSRIRVFSPGAAKLRTVYRYKGGAIATDSHGVLYVAETSGSIAELDTTHDGRFLRRINLSGQYLDALAIDKEDAAYMLTLQSGSPNHLLKVRAGETTSAWSEKVPPTEALALARGYVYLGANGMRIYESANGRFVKKMRVPNVWEIEVDEDSRIYVLSLGKLGTSSSILVFNRAGVESRIESPLLGAAGKIAVYP
jgi:outer membrane protein assembly factor BamB